ncbi:MAG: TRAP transporter substrate-binding protein [Betaproteobacteria bacterium]|jgi:tripartite ATP-independent transporter DctP family solute receptor|nr:TRAP transporter substrate-binding protein [Burkholderiaceae bacterium]MDH5245148.1 TRAP transporter substrate-binding protein [Betaproteobacteria bacterium]
MKLMILSAALAVAGTFASAPVAAQTTIKLGYATAPTSHYGVGSTAFCDEVEKRTSGRYKCQQFPNSALGGEREMIEAVQLGTLDVVNTSTGPIGNFVPDVNIVDIPFLFRDYDHARKTLDGPIGQELLAKFPAKGLVAIAWTENGFRHMTNSKRPINNPDDVKGLKIRTMQNKVHIQAFQSIGIQPTPMAFPELFTALQQGTVDGEENPIPVILSAKFAQVQKHLSLTGHVYSPALLIVSPALWNKLSDADKAAFREAGKAASAAQRKKVNDDERDGIAQLRAAGMEVVTNVDGTAFRNAMTPVLREFSKQYGADNIKRIQDVR